MSRLPVLKTYKLFIGGQFPRSESGRTFSYQNKKDETIANVCLSSKKDFKAAVVAARNAFGSWSARSSYNRGQILYRIAEMLEARRSQFIEEILLQGFSKKNAEQEVELSIDRLVYYAGWCDKYQQLFSSVNAVSTPHHNFSVPEPMGVVNIIAADESPLLGLISVMTPVIAGANTCVVLASKKFPLSSVTFAEVLATSDLPAGVVNILTGESSELLSHISLHMDVNALVYCNTDAKEIKSAGENCSINVKRFMLWNKNWFIEQSQNPYMILDLQEIKTIWHPIENIGSNSSKY